MTPPSKATIITLLTDFGQRDTFVAQMKGAAFSIHPEIRFVDLSHEVPPQDVEAAGYLLWTAYSFFPTGTLHVAVVDPGVGTARRALAVRTERHTFLAPDNGLLSRVLREEPAGSIHAIEASHYKRPEVSATFEGRDVFSVAAAWIARGTTLDRLGPPVADPVLLPMPGTALSSSGTTRVRVLWVDRFGNLTLDLHRRLLPARPGASELQRVAVITGNRRIHRAVRTYAEAPPGEPVLLFDSRGLLEVAMNRGRASDLLGLAPGNEVEVSIEDEH